MRVTRLLPWEQLSDCCRAVRICEHVSREIESVNHSVWRELLTKYPAWVESFVSNSLANYIVFSWRINFFTSTYCFGKVLSTFIPSTNCRVLNNLLLHLWMGKYSTMLSLTRIKVAKFHNEHFVSRRSDDSATMKNCPLFLRKKHSLALDSHKCYLW